MLASPEDIKVLLILLYSFSLLAVPCPSLGLLMNIFSCLNPHHLSLCVVESGLAGVFLLVCGLEERVSQMLPQCRSCQRSHSAVHAGLYPVSETNWHWLFIFS